MALLRNREVTVLRVADEIDGSTFQVRYPDGETELAKMNELVFTQREYDAFVRQVLPEAKILSDSEIKERTASTRPESTEDNKPQAIKAKVK